VCTVPADVLLTRLENLRKKMAVKGFDAILINHPANRYYVGGVMANDVQTGESAGWLVVGRDKAYGLFSSAHYEEWKDQACHLEVIRVQAPSARKYPVKAAELISANGWRAVAVDEDALSLRWYREILAGLGDGYTITGMDKLLDELRAVKDEWEVALVTKACTITWQAFETVLTRVKPGITEKELAWELENVMRARGAEGPGFDTIVAAGPGAAVPHHVPAHRKIVEGESVVVDMGAKVQGYCADMTRTFCFGHAPPRLKEIYGEVKAALDEAVSRAIVGNCTSYVAKAGADTGGHGVGLTVHEYPGLGGDAPLEPNMTLAIEPGIYVPGWGGVRLEDTVLIRPEGPERLTKAAMVLEV
jgi:Xaa-Pro aminopeptidase